MGASSWPGIAPEPAAPHRGDGERVCARSQLCKVSQKQGRRGRGHGQVCPALCQLVPGHHNTSKKVFLAAPAALGRKKRHKSPDVTREVTPVYGRTGCYSPVPERQGYFLAASPTPCHGAGPILTFPGLRNSVWGVGAHAYLTVPCLLLPV